MPTSTNQGSAYSAPFQRLAANAAERSRRCRGRKRSSARIQPAAANSGVQITSSCRTSGSARAGVEPLHVELVALVGGVRGGPAAPPGCPGARRGSDELQPDGGGFRAHRAACERQHMWISSSATDVDEHCTGAQQRWNRARELARHERMVPRAPIVSQASPAGRGKSKTIAWCCVQADERL